MVEGVDPDAGVEDEDEVEGKTIELDLRLLIANDGLIVSMLSPPDERRWCAFELALVLVFVVAVAFTFEFEVGVDVDVLTCDSDRLPGGIAGLVTLSLDGV